eukprot:TRINITY_DN1816_c0_g1_i1.p1 TRINITY_DN1816_c0_g1~~TRINITY_DN1816_c0_g1_i1.p1  ORF type:complete len:309 (+),score=86.73 TRINITY_DN1816_c0_g1_i1:42-929(+)
MMTLRATKISPSFTPFAPFTPSVSFSRKTHAPNARQFEGKKALITGSTSGIGLEIARSLASKGCSVVLHGLAEPAQLEKLRSDLAAAHSVSVLHSSANLAKLEETEKLAHFVLNEWGGVDILVNNAGIQYVAPIEQFPVDKFNDVININLSSAFHLIRLLLPAMKQKHWGRIINVASVHGLVASVNKSAYVAAKHGMVGLTKAVALETAETGVTSNAVCPGWVMTELISKQIQLKADQKKVTVEEGAKELLREKQPALRFVETDQLAEVVCFLASRSADLITGVSLPVDGGWTAQ